MVAVIGKPVKTNAQTQLVLRPLYRAQISFTLHETSGLALIRGLTIRFNSKLRCIILCLFSIPFSP